MLQMSKEVMPVKITADELNTYATIQRCCITGITACVKLGETRQAARFRQLREWAESNYDEKVRQRTS